ncbi:hypothetical protein K490DRAFT_61987 [Saccharata proteae CBS 121410]|uniref:Transcription factor domain-containing protein n=1 Tax=Saccharata proteae CBS 121410 TaxID=1314787 RepID=A0A9P4I167_9PEZI|nr:hypothetical protein K490DRAFT_61987 [Saccharata proteae CBS 121410]
MDHQPWNNRSWQDLDGMFRLSPSDAFSDASQMLGSDRENSGTPPRSIITDFASAIPSTTLSFPVCPATTQHYQGHGLVFPPMDTNGQVANLCTSSTSPASASTPEMDRPMDQSFSTGPMTDVHFNNQALSDASSWALVSSQGNYELPGSRHSSIGDQSQASDDHRFSSNMDLAFIHGHSYLAYSQGSQMAFSMSPLEGQLQAVNAQLNDPTPSDYYVGNLTQLPELLEYFLPNFVTSMHSAEKLKSFMRDHTTGWSNVHVRIKLIPGRNLPPIDCEAYEFKPVTQEPSRQFQYFQDSQTGVPQRSERPSPPLGLVQIDKPDIKRHSKYLSTVIEQSFEDLAAMCYGAEACDFQLQLLRLIKAYRPDNKKLLNESLRLLVVTYIMGHTLVLDEESKLHALDALGRSQSEYDKYVSPRVVNRQLKYLFHILHKRTMYEVYSKLQQVLKKSAAWPGKWTSTFCAILVLAMCHEMSQRTFHIIWDYKTVTDGVSQKDAERHAAKACEAIDAKFDFVNMLFMKRSAKCPNPLRERDVEPGHWEAHLREPAARFTERLSQLVESHQDHLNERQYVPIDKRGNFTSRLVSRFLNRVCHINGQ